MTPTWRVLEHPAEVGAWNMAVDEAIMEAVRLGASPPTLRLYAWRPACLSLGVAQPIRDVDQEALSVKGYELVRRPTGGRSILHTDELTYAVIGSEADPLLKGGVLESYQRISQGLLHALNALGIEAQVVSPAQAQSSRHGQPPNHIDSASNAVCFETPSYYEITCLGKKIIGSAQLRRKGAVLQHGSFPLFGDLRRILDCLNFASESARLAAQEALLARAATAEEILRRRITWEQAAAAFVAGFQEALGLSFTLGSLTAYEEHLAHRLQREKYANMQWTARV